MKKLIFLLLIGGVVLTFTNINAKQPKIPNEAIRLRIIPNSNNTDDQQLKGKVQQNVQKKLYELLKDTKSIAEARSLIEKELPHIEVIVDETLTSSGNSQPFKLNYGLNYFPPKKYKGLIYEEGYYESLVITLGNGEGDNWWCVLFPPLCLLEATEEQESSEVEYKFFVQEMLDKVFKHE